MRKDIRMSILSRWKSFDLESGVIRIWDDVIEPIDDAKVLHS